MKPATRRLLDSMLLALLWTDAPQALAQTPPAGQGTEDTAAGVAASVPAAGRYAVQWPGGGVVWATEDPTLTPPELGLSVPMEVAFEDGRLTRPVPIYLRSNYPAFVRRFELSIYRAGDTALTEALAVLPMPVAAVSRVDWQGPVLARFPLRVGDELVAVLRAYGDDGAVDETQPRRFRLVRPEDAERNDALLRDSVERRLGTALSVTQARSQSLIEQAFAGDELRQQNIPIYGSRIRIQGRNLPEGATLRINGETYPTDLDRKFVAEFLSPIGRHAFDLEIQTPDQLLRHRIEIEVTGNYLFGIGLADLTLYQNRATGPGRDLALAGRERDVLADGRLAFYGKAKIDGKYLVTAQADTRERDIRRLFSGFLGAEPTSIFRRLDPDLYYPTYGDDSSTVADVDTQGRLYLRVDWDKNQALWGNYQTGLAGTAYAQYLRSLYGAALKWRSTGANPWGEPRTQLRAFASQAQTAPGHSEFLGTGGSLYYLRHTDVVPGSETVVLELRDPATGRVLERRNLQQGVDYEISAMQGRILLARPLLQRAAATSGSITRDGPDAGYEQRLLVDYEWIPRGLASEHLSTGLRAKQWLNDHVALGGTVVEEGRAGASYQLRGADLTLQAGRGTSLRVEHSRSESTGVPVFFSSNGGFSFAQLNAATVPREGRASAVEAQVNLHELGWTARDWNLAAWWRDVDAGYSVARDDPGVARRDVGAELRGQLGDTLEIVALASRSTRGAEALEQAQLTARWRPTDDDTLTAEVRRVTEQRSSGAADGTLGALQYQRRVTPALELYGTAQTTLARDAAYADNDALTLGGRYRFANQSSLGAELTRGDRGDAQRLEGEMRLGAAHTVYGSIGHASDAGAYDPLFNTRMRSGWTLGQRWRVGERTNVFNESQYLKEREGAGLLHTFGVDFYPAVGWSTNLTLQSGSLRVAAGEVDRRAVSVAATRTAPDTEWSSKLEWREDSGVEQRRQWVSTNRLNRKLNEDWRLSARLNYADTDDRVDARASARFVESGVGFAWRPHDDTRYALLGRYTFLYDLATLGQQGRFEVDQKSHIVSVEGIYRYDREWEFAAKLAQREGRVRTGRGTGAWFDSATTFAAVQVRYTLPFQWHALAELRTLNVRDGGTRSGWLLGVDRDITANLRVGVGYNFTSFSDDLTRFDYRYRGWYLNLVGSY